LRAAGFHKLRHALFGDPLLLHLGCKLTRNHGLDRGGGDFLANAFLIEPALEAGAYMRGFSRHDCTSFNLCFASANDALQVMVVLTPGSSDTLSGAALLDTMVKLHERLREEGETRFPFVRYADKKELEESGAAQP
jgi:hypothetical protein